MVRGRVASMESAALPGLERPILAAEGLDGDLAAAAAGASILAAEGLDGDPSDAAAGASSILAAEGLDGDPSAAAAGASSILAAEGLDGDPAAAHEHVVDERESRRLPCFLVQLHRHRLALEVDVRQLGHPSAFFHGGTCLGATVLGAFRVQAGEKLKEWTAHLILD